MDLSPARRYRFVAPLVALVILGALYALSREPSLSDREADELAGRFRFERLPFPELSGYPQKTVREVHPSLRQLSAWISAIGAAVALADLDGDGLPNDLAYVDPRTDQAIVASAPGTIARYAPFSLNPSPLAFDAATMAPTGCLVGDFNEDGRPDILVYYWGRSPLIFLQRGESATGSLSQDRFVPRELIEPYQNWYTCAATQADLDGDGHLDLLIGNYYADGARLLDAAAPGRAQMPDSLCRAFNGGGVRTFLRAGANSSAMFHEAQAVLNDEVAHGWTFAVGAADLDGDLLPEIYVVSDFGPDRLLHNRSSPGKLKFELLHGERKLTTPRSSVLGRDTFNGMGMDFGDLNGDGMPDIFVSNIASNLGFHESNFVFLSRKGELHRMHEGIAPYSNASESLGLSRSGWAWEARLADFDNDGVLEAMQATGCTKGNANTWALLQETALMNDQLTSDPRFWHNWQPGDDIAGADHNPFYVRAGNGRYYDLARKIGLGEPMNSRGIAVADVDG
jgi:enediyne biosynthesis protein E4